MSPRAVGRTAPCSAADAAVRLEQARKFYEVAELTQTEASDLPSAASVSAALAVLAGIAAADAACCAALGERARDQNHKAAVTLTSQIEPGGPDAAKRLDRLLDVKDAAHYGAIFVSGMDLRAAMRNAKALVAFATGVVRRA